MSRQVIFFAVMDGSGTMGVRRQFVKFPGSAM